MAPRNRPASRERLAVLLYHHVGPPRPSTLPSLTVVPGRFERQLAWLARRGYRTLTLEQAVAWTRGGPLPPRSVMLTFDDGHADLREHAFPQLEAMGMTATVFLVTGLIGATSSWDAGIGGGGHALLDEPAIREWGSRGIDFAAHTRTHPDLTGVADAELWSEMVGSADDLERIMGRRPVAFAYPFGSYDERTLALARAEFAIAFTAVRSMNGPGADPHLLGRGMVQSFDRPLELELRIRLGYSPRERAWHRAAATRQRLRGLVGGRLRSRS